MIPLVVFSAIIAIGLLKIPNVCVKIFSVLGYIIKAIITVGLVVGILTFLTGYKPLPYVDSIENAMSLVLNAACVMTGALPLLYILAKIFNKPLNKSWASTTLRLKAWFPPLPQAPPPLKI